jgi:hypothetical protein
MITWKIEAIETIDGAKSTVHWRANGEHGATAYGTVSVDNLTITPATTEEEVVTKVKAALNVYQEQRDEAGNIIPPLPGKETEGTDKIEAALAAQAEAIAHPKTKTVKLPWVA